MKKIKIQEPNHFDSKNEIINLCFTETYIQGLTNFIKEKIYPPFSISIDGDWGTGKTHLMKIIEKNLNDQNYPTIWFNPWEYEKTDSSYIAFIKKLSISFKDKFKLALKDIGVFGISLAISSIDGVARLLTNDSINYSNIKDITEEVIKASQGESEKYSDTVELLRKDFVRITSDISTKKFGGKPLIIFIDDLDRCLPDNSLKLLEALKNTFSVKDAPVIFICGQNINITKEFLTSKYASIGYEYASNYFKKIFDISIKIPGIQQEQIKELIKYKLSESFDNPKSDLVEIIQELNSEIDNKSLRVIDKIIFGYHFYDNMNESKELDIEFVIFWLFLKEKWAEDYSLLSHDIIKDLSKTFASIQDFNSYKEKLTQACKKFIEKRFIKYNEMIFSTLQNNQIL